MYPLLSFLIVVVFAALVGDVDVVESLAVHLLESQTPVMYKDEVGEGHVV